MTMLEAFEVKNPVYPVISFLSSIVLCVFGMLFSKHLAAFAFAGAVFLLYCFFGLFGGAWKMTLATAAAGLVIGGLSYLTNNSLDAFWQTLLRMILLGLCAVPMVTVSPCSLTRCLNSLKCPRVITLGMLVTLRFVPIIASEIKRISEAMKVRGVNMKKCNPSVLYRAFFIPLVMRIIGISDTLSLSLETRAFTVGGEAASVYEPVKVHFRDVAFAVCVAAICIAGGVFIWARQ